MAGRHTPAGAADTPPGTSRALGTPKQIAAGLLDVGYTDAGPVDGRVVILLHGWPYDVHSFVEVVPLLAGAGYRVIVPHLRGFGTTRFLSSDTIRNGQQAALALDVIALMDALRIEKAIVAGFDWGARTADIVAALWPERCHGLVAVSGYLIANREVNRTPLTPEAEYAWWYRYYFATDRGERGYSEHRREFARLIWRLASPAWQFDEATFERAAGAFDNPDHVRIVIHNYRWRLGIEVGEPQSTRSKPRSPGRRSSQSPRSRSRATPTERRTRTAEPTPRGSPAGTPIASSLVASATTCHRKRHERSLRPSLTSRA